MAGWSHTEISVRHRELNPDTVTHLSTNRTRRRLTSLIEANVLTTTPDHQLLFGKIFLIKSHDVANQCIVFFNCSVSDAKYNIIATSAHNIDHVSFLFIYFRVLLLL